jgi:hypothetical protein
MFSQFGKLSLSEFICIIDNCILNYGKQTYHYHKRIEMVDVRIERK